MMKKALKTLAAAVLLASVFGTTAGQNGVKVIYAQEEAALVQEENKESAEETPKKEGAEAQDTNAPQKTELPETDMTKVWFRLFLCICFGVGISVVIAIWGNPNERLKSRYKRARKLQKKQEKERLAKERAEQKLKEQEAQAEKQKEEE